MKKLLVLLLIFACPFLLVRHVTAQSLTVSTTITANVTCHGGSNGSASASVSGGATSYTYSWTPGGETTQIASGLIAGTYTVLVTDHSGATATASATITQPTVLGVSATESNVSSCSAYSDSLYATATGGTGVYIYSWLPVTGLNCHACQNTVATPISSTVYTVTVTDTNGCTTSASVTANTTTNVSIIASSDSIPQGQSDTLSASFNRAISATPITYLWSDGETTSTIIVSPDVSTQYTITATDANGCTTSASTIIYRLAGTACYEYVIGDQVVSANGASTFYITTSKPDELIIIYYNAGGWTNHNITQKVKVDGNLASWRGFNIGNYGIDFQIYGYVAPTATIHTITCDETDHISPFYENFAAGFYSTGCSHLTVNSFITPYFEAGGTSGASYRTTIPHCLFFSEFAQTSFSSPPYTYTWNPNLPNIAQTISSAGTTLDASILISPAALTGSYTVACINNATSYLECFGTALIEPPYCFGATATTTYSSCVGNISVNAVGGTTPYTYTWNPNVSSTATASGLSAGTYTITVTSPVSCSASTTVTITTPASITASPSNTLICPGTAVTLSVTSLAGATYTWSNGATTTTTIVYPSNCNDTYSVTVHDGECNYIETYTTSNVLTLEMNSEDGGYVCGGSTVEDGSGSAYSLPFSASLLCNNCSDVSYTWTLTPPGGDAGSSISSSGNSATVKIPFSDDITIEKGFTITVSASCGDFSCSQQSYVVSGCCENYDESPPTLINPQLSSYDGNANNLPFAPTNGIYSVSVSGTTWTFTGFAGDPLYINGDFIVDEPLIINNSDIIFGPNAVLQIITGGSLTMTNCHLHACEAMWQGISTFNSNSAPSITINNCLIEDAVTAIGTNSGSSITIAGVPGPGSCFNRDYVGIEIEDYTGSGAYPLTLSNATFSCNGSSTWNSGTYAWSVGTSAETLDGYGPYTGQMSYMGILLNNVDNITVGTTSGSSAKNTFQNLYYGIYSKKSNVTVYNNTFQDIYYSGSGYTHYGTTGCGVMVMGSNTTANIGGSASNEPNTFSTSRYGVIGRDTINVNIPKNTFTAISNTGITLENNFKTNLNVGVSSTVYNTISASLTGVYADNNPSVNAQINWNNVTSAVGISVVQNGYDPKPTFYISENNISSVGGTSVSEGIYGKYFYGTVKSNDITISNTCTYCSPPPIADGIYMVPAANSDIYNNTITCVQTNRDDGIVMQAPYCSNNLITCNNMNSGVNSACFVYTQKIGTYFDWNQMNSYNNTGIYFNSTGDIGPQGNSINGTHNYWNTCGSGSPWATYNGFLGVTTTRFYISSTLSGCNYLPTNNYRVIGSTLIPFTSSTEEDCYVCSGTNPCSNNNHNNLTTAIAISIASEHFSAATGAYPTATLWDEKNDLYVNLKSVDSTFLDSSSVIRNFYDSVETANMGYLQNIAAALSDSNGVSSSDISTAETSYAAISSTADTTEATAKSVYNILIQMISGGQSFVDSTQEVFLQTIAPLCPFEYGYGVYLARALLSPVDTTVYRNACETDTNSSGERMDAPAPKPKPDLSANVYPNPANSAITIQIIRLADTAQGNKSKSKTEYFYLYNELGELMEKATLTNDITTLPLSQVAAGIYYYRLVDNEQNEIRTDKLLIIR